MTTIEIILISVGIVLSLIGIGGHIYLFLKRRKARSVRTIEEPRHPKNEIPAKIAISGGRATEEPLESTKDSFFAALARRLSFLKDKF
jgi:flagellar basal body-associated protein FliL